MDDALLQVLLPTISFVSVQLFAMKIARFLKKHYARFLERTLGLESLDDSAAPNSKTPSLARFAVRSAGYGFMSAMLAAALFVWASVLKGMFWVPPWLENNWATFVVAGAAATLICLMASFFSTVGARLLHKPQK